MADDPENVFAFRRAAEGAPDLYELWMRAYEAGRAAPTVEQAQPHYDAALHYEGLIAALPPSVEAARMALRVACRQMDDEHLPDEEPSYAGMMRATLEHLDGALSPAEAASGGPRKRNG